MQYHKSGVPECMYKVYKGSGNPSREHMVNRSKQIYTGRRWNVVNMMNDDNREFSEGHGKIVHPLGSSS